MDEIPELAAADEELSWPACEYFRPDPSPYTLSSLRWFTDWRGERHYW